MQVGQLKTINLAFPCAYRKSNPDIFVMQTRVVKKFERWTNL